MRDRVGPGSGWVLGFLWSFWAGSLAVASQIPEQRPADPLSPEASLRSIRVMDGFRVELVASEPLVTDPIAFDWGADGRLWVVEMGDYPLGLDGKGSPGGSIKILEDSDGDGRYDRSTVFLGGLGFPTGVMPWRNGVLISRAPDILYAEDTDGDRKADRVEVLFTGFVPGNPQHRVNGFDLGLDGWVYGANGDSGGTITSPGSNAPGVSIRGRDFRFDPDSRSFEPESGQTQFGRHRDDWGRWFGNNNSRWAWHVVLNEQALKRQPSLTLASPVQQLDLDPRLFPDSLTATRFNSPRSANRVTSANSPTPYRDDLFGTDFDSSVFVSEPVHNMVRRMILGPDGSSLRARAELDAQGREFLASTDAWFRPTMLKAGPDGALWIADMYRAVIEHPDWIPDEVEAKLDLRAGSDRGRIYRVLPVGLVRRPIPRLDRLDTIGLVAALTSSNGWQRDTAQRLLGHRRDPLAIEPIRILARSSPNAKSQVQALWTLRNLGGMNQQTTGLAVRANHPQVRRAGIETASLPSALDLLLPLVDDLDPEVRFALAIALGDVDDPRSGAALGRLAVREANDHWAKAAILSSSRRHAGAILGALLPKSGSDGLDPAWSEPLLASLYARPNLDELSPVLAAIGTPNKAATFAPWQFAALAGLFEAADRTKSPVLAEAAQRLSGVVEAARGVAGDDRAADSLRINALRLLGRSAADRGLLIGLIQPRVADQVQAAALRALSKSDDRRVADAVLGAWNGLTPASRVGVLDLLLIRASWTATLLSSLEDKCVPPTEIPRDQRRRLLDHPDRKLRDRAEAIFELAAVSRRRDVLEAYRPELLHGGDSKSGAGVFRKSCVACHRLEGVGHAVGPDLLTLTDISSEMLLVGILDPNRVFEARYSDYTIHLTDGRILSGLIAGESANSVTLLRSEGRQEVLLRSEIETISASGRSLMPEGLEKEMTPREFADLVAYLLSLRASSSSSKVEARPR